MKTITKGQLIDYYNLAKLDERVDLIPWLDSCRNKKDDYVFWAFKEMQLIEKANDKQKVLLREWGIIEDEPKFKDDYYIMCGLVFAIARLRGDGKFDYIGLKGERFYFPDKDVRLATPEEIAEHTLIKLEIGTYIYHSDYGVYRVNDYDTNHTRYHLTDRHKKYLIIFHGDSLHKESKIATPEQIKQFNCIWNEGIEEAKKYKDGQACLVKSIPVKDIIKTTDWILRYADGNGKFYLAGLKDGIARIEFKFHLPLNEQTIKNLPVNE